MTTPAEASDTDWGVTWQRADVLWSLLADRLDANERDSIATGIYEPLLEGLLALRPVASEGLRAALEAWALRFLAGLSFNEPALREQGWAERRAPDVAESIMAALAASDAGSSMGALAEAASATPPAGIEAVEKADAALANMQDFILNGKATLNAEQVSRLKAMLSLDVGLIHRALAAAASPAEIDGKRLAQALHRLIEGPDWKGTSTIEEYAQEIAAAYDAERQGES